MINKALNHLEELLVTFLMGAATLIIFVPSHTVTWPGWQFPGCRTGC